MVSRDNFELSSTVDANSTVRDESAESGSSEIQFPIEQAPRTMPVVVRVSVPKESKPAFLLGLLIGTGIGAWLKS